MHPADTLTHIALDRHRERTQLAHRVDDGAILPRPRPRGRRTAPRGGPARRGPPCATSVALRRA